MNDVHIWSHTTHQRHKLLNLWLQPSSPLLCLEQTRSPKKFKMAPLLVNMSHKTFMLLWVKHQLHSSIYPNCKNELPFNLNYLDLCTTQSCSLNVNPIKISNAYKYVMIGASSCISKVLSLFDSISTPWQPMVFMSIKVHCHPKLK